MTPDLTGDLNDSGAHWKGCTAGCILSSRLLGLLGQLLYTGARWANQGDADPNPVPAEGGLIRAVKMSVSLGCSDHEISAHKGNEKGLQQSRDAGSLEEKILASSGDFWGQSHSSSSSTQGQQSCTELLVFQDTTFHTKQLSALTHRKTTGYLRTETWLKRDLMKKLHRKKKASKRWMLGLKEGFRSRDGFLEAKASQCRPLQGLQGHQKELLLLLLLQEQLRNKENEWPLLNLVRAGVDRSEFSVSFLPSSPPERSLRLFYLEQDSGGEQPLVNLD